MEFRLKMQREWHPLVRNGDGVLVVVGDRRYTARITAVAAAEGLGFWVAAETCRDVATPFFEFRFQPKDLGPVYS